MTVWQKTVVVLFVLVIFGAITSGGNVIDGCFGLALAVFTLRMMWLYAGKLARRILR
jgi:hypothetical protein